MDRAIVALVSNKDDREAILRSVGVEPRSVILPATAADAVAAMTSHPAAVVVVELAPETRAEAMVLFDAVSRSGRFVSLVIRVRLTPDLARTIVASVPPLQGCRLSLRGCDDLVQDVAGAFRAIQADTAHAFIIRKTAALVPRETADIYTGAVFLGTRRTSVQRLASLCGLPPRTLEWRLASALMPTSRFLLGWMVVLHAAWALEVLNWPVKRTATEVGFSSRPAFEGFFKRYAQLTPSEVRRQQGFWSLLDRLAALLQTPPHPRAVVGIVDGG